MSSPGDGGSVNRPYLCCNPIPHQECVMLGNRDMSKISRRRFLKLGALALPAVATVHARLVEPRRLRVTQLQTSKNAQCRFVHFSDLHYRGDATYMEDVVTTINELKPEFACFTGDLVENKAFASEGLSFIRQIKVPVYGNPGNHDYWSGASFPEYERAFAATGGAWLVDRSIIVPKYELEIHGMARVGIHAFKAPVTGRRLLLMHYPAMADTLGARFDLILAGHSHGGQIRLPFYGPVIIPTGVGRYDLGSFETPNGPLYVNAGIGTLASLPVRWNCRPEITVVTM
jgi:predicted MPP superfamily phosphohydrolase